MPSEINNKKSFMAEIRALNEGRSSKAMVTTYGCQQNEADSQRLRGLLREMGYELTEDAAQADVIILNSCAVRAHAEDRVFGNIGALSHYKRARPETVLCLAGCMAAEQNVRERIRKSYPYVDLTFPPDKIWMLPELLYGILTERKRRQVEPESEAPLIEGLPEDRQRWPSAWLSIIYGCNNFCTYCIVPYVRGRERSRSPEAVIKEAGELLKSGIKDITLLGQNVNAYRFGDVDFPDLLRMVNALPGEFVLRFMTSHPKDADIRLFKAMAESEKAARHLHLPFQSGNDEILRRMNRRYGRARYLELISQVRELMPDISLTSDVIVGFPGETEKQFEDTLKLVEQVRFDALFTFIYSPREGTAAYKYDDPIPREEKQVWFDRLLEVQNRISLEKHREYIGKICRCLVDGRDGDLLTARTNGGRLVRLPGKEELIGSFVDVKILDCTTWSLSGEMLRDV
ncbi:MAG: tRNA (N6-isopentenyl adenosine(37)-C2)-methylthiotransferase MiaB [Oscillospiraceae bacterium]